VEGGPTSQPADIGDEVLRVRCHFSQPICGAASS